MPNIFVLYCFRRKIPTKARALLRARRQRNYKAWPFAHMAVSKLAKIKLDFRIIDVYTGDAFTLIRQLQRAALYIRAHSQAMSPL